MPLPLAAVLPAVGAAVGGVAQGLFQRGSAREQMRFQERMSGTAYQRAVADMRLAGINPMLAYMQGGASSPGGAQPQWPDMLSPAVSSAMQAMRLREEIKLLRAQQEKTNVEAMESQQRRQNAHVAWSLALETLPQQVELVRQSVAMGAADVAEARNRLRFEAGLGGRSAPFVDFLRRSVFGGGAPLAPLRYGFPKPEVRYFPSRYR